MTRGRADIQMVQSHTGLVFTSQTVLTCKLRAETECDSLDRSVPQRFLHHTLQVDSYSLFTRRVLFSNVRARTRDRVHTALFGHEHKVLVEDLISFLGSLSQP